MKHCWFTFILPWRGNQSITGGFFLRHESERDSEACLAGREFLKFLNRGKREEEREEKLKERLTYLLSCPILEH